MIKSAGSILPAAHKLAAAKLAVVELLQCCLRAAPRRAAFDGPSAELAELAEAASQYGSAVALVEPSLAFHDARPPSGRMRKADMKKPPSESLGDGGAAGGCELLLEMSFNVSVSVNERDSICWVRALIPSKRMIHPEAFKKHANYACISFGGLIKMPENGAHPPTALPRAGPRWSRQCVSVGLPRQAFRSRAPSPGRPYRSQSAHGCGIRGIGARC